MIDLIGLTGPSRAGKDLTAGFLVQDFGFTQRNMASAIREILLKVNPYLSDVEPVPLQYVFEKCQGDWDVIKKCYPETVDAMINLGQAARDIINVNVWLDIVLKDRPEKLVLADVRQPNEYEKIKELGGQVWKITRPTGTQNRGMDGLLEGYEMDAHIDNRGSLSDLRGQVQAIMSSQIHGEYIQKNDFL